MSSSLLTAPVHTALAADALITSNRAGALSLPVERFHAAVAAGYRVVDIRTQAQRSATGVVPGALAIDPSVVLDRLTPGTPDALRAAAVHDTWILISADGHDAEWATWHLQARGVLGARFLLGGVAALRDVARRDGAVLPLSRQCRRDLATIAAH